MEQQVAEAALAMVRTTTDGTTRMAASQFLEQWTHTAEAWGVYASWLHSFHDNSNSINGGEKVGMQLLCLTLLQAKIRREVPRGTQANQSLAAVQNEIAAFLQGSGGGQHIDNAIIMPLCICTAALAARCGNLNDLVMTCRSGTSIPIITSLRILSCIPTEVENIAELTTPQVTAELWPVLETVLDMIRTALTSEETAAPALEALTNWAKICHVSLSHLNIPTCGGSESLLPPLIQLLSSTQPARPEIWISASHALTEAVLVPSDSCTPARQTASASLLNAITAGFVVAPLAYATQHEWDDASHALATLVCTLVTEEVDDFCTQPAEPCLNLLLQIQSHPHTPVAITALECWLTVQELPTASRHDNWKSPLFIKVVEGLLVRIAYPESFINWEDELELDKSEFDELRRMVTDVFVSSYFLLRARFVQMIVNSIVSSNTWSMSESALFCLFTVAREVCARIKARGGGTSVSSDRDATAQQLLQLVEQLCGADPVASAKTAAQKHPLVLAGVVKFVGAYAPAWNVKCSSEALLQLLAYLRAAMLSTPAVVLDAAKAARSIFVSCSTRLLSCDHTTLLTSLRETVDTVLATDNEEAMATVAEGSTRLLVQIKDENIVRQSLATIVGPLLQKSEAAVNIIPSDDSAITPEVQRAVELLGKYLHVLKVTIQFCDDGPIRDMIVSVWPLLEKVAQKVSQHEYLLDKLLAVHQQLLKNSPDYVSSYLEQTIKFVVQVFEAFKNPSSLEYITGAVEAYGSSNVESFKELLNHVSVVVFTYLSTEKRAEECPDLIRAYFEMNQRYIIYCPAALVGCQQFPTIVSMAVECLTSCRGERESTRATLNFLTQLFGWRSLRIDKIAEAALEASAARIDEQLAQHGRNLTRSCVAGLIGGPTMLWPALSECLFAVIHVVVCQSSNPNTEEKNHQHQENTVAHQWLYEAAQQDSHQVPTETYRQVVLILTRLARNGTKSKSKAKMLLTDFAKIAKGEMTPDALVSYTLE